MGNVMINGVSTLVPGISVSQLREKGTKGGGGDGNITDFIRKAINERPRFIVDLEDDLIQEFKDLPEGQARVRINHYVSNHSKVVMKADAVYTDAPRKIIKNGVEITTPDYRGGVYRIVCTKEWMAAAQKEMAQAAIKAQQERKEAEAAEFGIGD